MRDRELEFVISRIDGPKARPTCCMKNYIINKIEINIY